MPNEIIIKIIKGKNAEISILSNGEKIKGVKDFNLKFEDSKLNFSGTRLKTDRNGQYFVEDGVTANEKIDFLNYLNDEFLAYDFMSYQEKHVNFNLYNIYLTSKLNAQNYIKERGCEM